MKEEDLLKEAQEVEKEINEVKEVRKFSPLWYILGVFLALMMVVMTIPYYSIKLDPEPSRVVSIEEVVPSYFKLENYSTQISTKEDYVRFVNPENVKIIADKIASLSCKGNKICQTKAIYYFIRDNYQYISDPVDKEYVEDPREFLSIGGGDCESGSIALASLEEAIGIRTQLVFVSGHAYLRIFLPGALNRYKRDDNWVYLDWTCKNCKFGEIPYQNLDKPETYLSVS